MDQRADRIRAFLEALAWAQATEVVPFGWGWGLLQRDFPASWDHNRVLVTGPADPNEVLARADVLLGGAGHRHRAVTFPGDVDPACARRFAAAGYAEPLRVVAMIHQGDPPPPGEGAVEVLPYEVLRPSLIEDQRAIFPHLSGDEAVQLADRTLLARRYAELALLAVRDAAGAVVARAELLIADGIAQVENLVTRPEHRGRGLARAVLAAGVRRARAAGAGVVFLLAEADDWPRTWYRRSGFQEVATSHLYVRVPDAAG